jgi:hypothetical protein
MTYLVKLAVALRPIWHADPPRIRIGIDDDLTEIVLTESTTIDFEFVAVKECQLVVELLNKTDADCIPEQNLDKAIVIESVDFFGISDPKFAWAGIYEPVYDFEKSEEYREEQNNIIELQKAMVSSDTAAICNTNWTVQNSERRGKAVIQRFKKLMLRAFNGESDVLIAKVKWNNVNQMKERMQKIFNAVNKLGEGFNVFVNEQYLDLKVKELILEYEYQAKRHKEKEEMRAIQDELREEETAKREFERAQ